MKCYVAKILLFFFVTSLVSLVHAKEIPVSASVVKRHADAVFVGEINRVTETGSFFLVEVTVVETFFDRRNEIAGVVTLSLHSQGSNSNFKPMERYVLVSSTCGNGSHILLGRNFSARVKNGYAETFNWHGFDEKTKLSVLRAEFSKYEVKDDFLTDQLCKRP